MHWSQTFVGVQPGLLRNSTPLPRYMVAMTHPTSPHRLTSELAREAFERLHAGKVIQTLFVPGGEPRRCFGNVLQRVEKDGGSIALGWLVRATSGGAARNRNLYARITLEPHAVWRRPDGRLLEITDGNRGVPFLPHCAVPCPANAAIAFVDSRELAEQWQVPGIHHLIVPVPASAPEPQIIYGFGPLVPSPRP